MASRKTQDHSATGLPKRHKSESSTVPQFPVAHRPTLRDFVYTEIYGRIIDGTLPNGARLNEFQTAKQMGMSRGPVREAIRQLERDGLLVTFVGKGTFIAGLSPDDLSDSYLLRTTLESLAARLLIERMKSEDLDDLARRIQVMKTLPHAGPQMSMVTRQFHGRICELSGNRALLRAWQTTSDQMRLTPLSRPQNWKNKVDAHCLEYGFSVSIVDLSRGKIP